MTDLQPVLEPLLEFPVISLSQLQTEAAFLTRFDRKYIVPEEMLSDLLRKTEAGTRVLEIDDRRTFGYSTRYFDYQHLAYFRALRKRADRFKVRTRLYDERGECWLEVKLVDSRGRTVKTRFPHDAEQFDTLLPVDRARLQAFEAVRPVAFGLEPSIATHYRRSTLVFPGGSGRMTLDQGLTFIPLNGCWRQIEQQCIVEVKGDGHALPFDRLLWAAGCRPVPASKFALGVSLVNPELPDNRWHRLRRRLVPSICEGGGPADSSSCSDDGMPLR